MGLFRSLEWTIMPAHEDPFVAAQFDRIEQDYRPGIRDIEATIEKQARTQATRIVWERSER